MANAKRTAAKAATAAKTAVKETKATEKTAVEVMKETEAAGEKAPAAEEKVPAAAVKKAPTKKETAAKKTTAKKAEPKATVTIEFQGRSFAAKEILEKAKKEFSKANKGVEIKTIDIYVKPEESVAYYVVNGIGSDDYKVVL